LVDTSSAVNKEIGRRRIVVANAVAGASIVNWAFSFALNGVDLPAVGTLNTYHVSAKGFLTSANSQGAWVSGSSITRPELRGTLTATLINR
jgi:hypothetical protein